MTRPATIAFVHGGAHFHLATLADPALAPYRIRDVYLREYSDEAVGESDVVVVGDRLRPDLLAARVPDLLGVARSGRTLVVLGESGAQAWLPGDGGEPRPTNFWWWRTGEDCGLRRRPAGHPIERFFQPRALLWHYHGVLRPPPGAVSLVDLEEDGAVSGSVLYLDEVSTPGRILATTMDPAYHHGSGFMPGATQLLYGILLWAATTGVSGR